MKMQSQAKIILTTDLLMVCGILQKGIEKGMSDGVFMAIYNSTYHPLKENIRITIGINMGVERLEDYYADCFWRQTQFCVN